MSYDLALYESDGENVDWKVTRSLVSYDLGWSTSDSVTILKGHQIIGELRLDTSHLDMSPLNWKVTRSLVSYDQATGNTQWFRLYWKVTRSLVSYDKIHCISAKMQRLKGHQIIGELRLCLLLVVSKALSLKGHQIIGELRPSLSVKIGSTHYWKVTRSLVSYDHWHTVFKCLFKLKGHQIIGELRLAKFWINTSY